MMSDMAAYFGQGKTILCIDDDEGMLDYERALFERRGYNVLIASSARQGLQIASVCAVAAVIVDYNMPELNGHEVAASIKRLKPQLPIIMVSSDESIPQPEINVIDAFVPKDQAPSLLVPVVARICGSSPASRESRVPASADMIFPSGL